MGESLVGSSLVSITKSGNVLGTPDYMAPEQLTGKRVTSSADIYSFGLVIYEMVTGRKPFEGGIGLKNAARRLTETPERPGNWVAGLTKGWERVILSCLERDAERRPAVACTVAEELRASR